MVLSPDLPLSDFPLDIAGRRWTIAAVRDQDALLDAAHTFVHVPYGLLLWESAVVLAGAVSRRPQVLAGRSVLELGCGTGLVGLVAASLGAVVLQTDHEPAALTIAAENARRNGIGGIRRLIADWRRWPVDERFDVILGADVLYEPALHDDVARILSACLAPDGLVLLADPGRPGTLAFLGRLEREGWRVSLEVEPADDLLAPGRRVEVTLIECAPPRR